MQHFLTTAGPLGVFIVMFGTAVLPWLNAELAIMVLPHMTQSRAGLAALFAVAVAGHMAGKSFLYWLTRRGGRALPARADGVIEKLSARLNRHTASAVGLTFFSSLTGFPPFYLLTLAAGAVRMHFAIFLAAGTAGRVIHLLLFMLFGDSVVQHIRTWYHGG